MGPAPELTAAASTTLRVLEFDAVLERLAGYAQTVVGAASLRALRPVAADERGRRRIERRLSLHAEAADLVAQHGGPGLGGAESVMPILDRARADGVVLEAAELLSIARAVRAAAAARRWVRSDPERWPRVSALAEGSVDLSGLAQQIEGVLSPEGEVREDASPQLRRLRRQHRSLRARVRERLERLVHEESLRNVLRDALVTERGGRMVVPVRPQQRDKLQGIVHGTSATRQTLYVEPLALVEDQNRVAEIVADERAEVLRLLSECSGHVRAAASELFQAEQVMAQADVVHAVARYAAEAEATMPCMGADELLLREAVHPLAEAPGFVPLQLAHAPESRALVITGPNTGGKTVALKTIGTIALMALCGLPVPAAEARLPWLLRVHADIGDEQSLAANLSTFSGHVANIIEFLADCPEPSLVLLDELGTGTDPAEGAALGIALLERFLDAGARLVVSTHHDALKSFAHRHPQATNAAMEFDLDTLAPTYRIRVGRPGRSNALDIAAGLGLEPGLIGRARELLSNDAVQLDDVIRGLESDARAARSRLQELERERSRLAAERADLRGEATRHEAELERQRQRAQEALDAALAQIRSEGDARLAELQPQDTVSQRTRADSRARWAAETSGIGARAKARLRRSPDKSSRRATIGAGEQESPANGEAPLRRGDRVKIAPFGLRGRMLQDWEPGQDVSGIEVDVDGKRVICRRRQVTVDAAVRAQHRRGRGVRTSYRRRHDVKPDIDLHGMTVERALEVLDKYLDDALLAGFSSVRLIHGHGTLRLRDAIQDWLSRRPGVSHFGAAEPQYGGVGVTIVELGS